VHVVFSKWGGVPHWEFDAVRLGEDAFGVWVLVPQGTRVTRPGYVIESSVAAVSMFAHDTPAVPHFHRTEGAPREVVFTIYVDICLARTSCDDVVRAMRARQEPYRSVGWDWLQ